MSAEDFKRKLTAVMSADVAGYSRLMAEDEAETVKTLNSYKEVMSTLIKQHRGRVVDSTGDNLLAEFASVVDAVQCAVSVQKEFQARNAGLPENRRMEFRIGINLGDVIEEEDRIFGDGVNIAARLESLAEPGGICVSKTSFDHIESKLPLGYEYLGEQTVKNIPKPVGAYRVVMEPRVTAAGLFRGRRAIFAGVVVAVVVVLALGVWRFYLSPPKPAVEPASVEKMAFPLPDEPSIAVLPFTNMSGDPQQEYLSDGLAEQIIIGLSMVPRLFVIARNSTFTYKGKAVKVQQVAEELGVRYVLEGSVQRSGERIRISAQLIDALTGRHLWADRYDRDLKDLFALQDEITMKIMSAIDVKLTTGDTARHRAKGTDNLEAYIKVLQASEYLFRRTKEGNIQARKLYEEAIALDPEYPAPYSLLGMTRMFDVLLGLSKSPPKSLQEATRLIQKALAIDESHPFANSHLALAYAMQGQHEKSLAQAERAVTLNPNMVRPHIHFGKALFRLGRYEEAIQSLEKAIRLDPKGQDFYFIHLGHAYCFAGRYEEAISAVKKAVGRAPNSVMWRIDLAATYSMAGREEEARAEVAEVLRLDPKFSLERYGKFNKWRKAEREPWFEALRKAGLPETPPLPLPDKPSIAVLPFVNMSGDPEQEYFSDGVTESIIAALSKAPRLFVISRSSTFTYKGKPVNVKRIGRELGVRYVLEGSVQRSGDRVRITAQLIDATTESHIWAERYDRDLKDIFALQDEITMKIVAAMQLKLTEGETARLHLKGTDNLEAYTKWLQAHFYFNQYTPDDNVRARKILEQVIALDPGYPAAYSRLALTHVLEVYFDPRKATKERIQESIKLAQKALSMDDSDPLSHVALGRIYYTIKQYEKAIVKLNQALALNPNLVEANRWLGFALLGVGKPQEALPFIKKALRLNPVEKGRTAALGYAYQRMGKYEEAIEAYKECIRFRPNHFFSHFGLVVCYVALDREEAAHAEAAEVFRINPKYSVEASEKRWPKGWEPTLKTRVYEVLRQAGLK